MAKGNAIVMYLEQARIHGEPIGVTRSEVLFTKPNGYTVQPHNRVVSKADNKTMGESFLNELIYVLGAEDGEERWADSLWLREELGRLDDRSRTVILLKFYEDMTFREIAQVLRKPESTVKSDYYRGMNQLKERTTQI